MAKKKSPGMTLTTEDLGDIAGVTEADIDRLCADDAFGKFLVLSASKTDFLQAACNWSPSAECKEFLKRTGSDPWLIEYHDPRSGKHYAAQGDITLDQVKEALIDFLRRGENWRTTFTWVERTS
jgi:hypothetical protein